MEKLVSWVIMIMVLVLGVFPMDTFFLSPRSDSMNSEGGGESWAVVFHFQPFKGWMCDRDITEILCLGGWQEDHIRIFEGSEITRKNFFETMSWLDEKEEEGDTVLFFYNGPGHKGGIKLYNNEYYVAYPELDDLLDNLESSSIGVVLDACHSGAAGAHISDEGRVIVTGGTDEEKISNFMLSNLLLDGLLRLGDIQGNIDGYVSLEEAFHHVMDQWTYPAHPQIWDMYPGELIVTKIEGDDSLDQYQIQGDRISMISDTQWVAQSFHPQVNRITRIYLYLKINLGTPDPLEIALRDSLDGPDIQVAVLPPEECGSLYQWIEIDIDNGQVTPGRCYYVLCRMTPGSHGNSSYGWRGISSDFYQGGNSYLTPDGGMVWQENHYAKDCVFLIYGTRDENEAPLQPSTPQGSTQGKKDHPYTYTTVATDIEGDTIRYGWDWNGDNHVDEWSPFYPSGEPIENTHIWENEGHYMIQVVAQDDKGAQSIWSPSLNVTLTRTLLNALDDICKQRGEIWPFVMMWVYQTLIAYHDICLDGARVCLEG